jgi:hypothetical protein
MNGFLVALGVLAAGLFIVGWVRARLADPPRSALMESIPILLAGLILYLAFWIGIVAVVIGI